MDNSLIIRNIKSYFTSIF